MKTLRWRPIADTPKTARDMTAMIACIDVDESYLLPGPVMWDISRAGWIREETGEPVRFDAGNIYRWIPESDLIS